MPRLRAALPIIGFVAVLVLGACSSETTQSDQPPAATESPAADHGSRKAVPEGVARQYATVSEEIAEHGGETTSGEWRVGYIIEAAEPWFVPAGSGYNFRQPAPDETNHIEIIPIEAKTGRIVPDVPIRLEILDSSGRVVQAKHLNFYYSEFFHYANNFSVSGPGRYTLRATLGVPTFLRHGEQGQTPPLAQGTTVQFTDVEIKAGG